MKILRSAFALLSFSVLATAWAAPIADGQQSADGFQAFDLPAEQAGRFEVTFDATPLADKIDVFTGLSREAPKIANDVAVIVRFNEKGMIDARNGGVFAAEQPLAYSANKTYRMRLVVDVTAHKYSVFVTPQGQAEVALASNYAFRSQQSSVQSLGKVVLAGFKTPFGFTGPHRVNGFSVRPM